MQELIYKYNKCVIVYMNSNQEIKVQDFITRTHEHLTTSKKCSPYVQLTAYQTDFIFLPYHPLSPLDC